MKMQKSTEIQTEIEKTQSRIAELEPQLAERKAAFDAAQKQYVAAKIDFDALNEERAKHDLMEKVVESLHSTVKSLEGSLQTALESEARQSVLMGMKKSAEEAEKAYKDLLAKRNHLDETARAAVDALLKFQDHQREFEASFRVLAPNVEGFRGITNRVRPEFDGAMQEVESVGVSKDRIRLVTSANPPLPSLYFGKAFETAHEVVKLDRYYRDQERREKERDARAIELAAKKAAYEKAEEEKREALRESNRAKLTNRNPHVFSM